MTAVTSQKLADTLRAAGFLSLAERAEADEFHDFLSPHASPTLKLVEALAAFVMDDKNSKRQRVAAHHIGQRLIDGEFDATSAESEAWAENPAGQDAFKRLAKGE
jgi:hypothetical protein